MTPRSLEFNVLVIERCFSQYISRQIFQRKRPIVFSMCEIMPLISCTPLPCPLPCPLSKSSARFVYSSSFLFISCFNFLPISWFSPPPFHFPPILSASHHLFFPLWIQHLRKFSEHALISIIHAGVLQDSFKHAVRNWVHSWAKVSEEGDFYYSDALCRIQINSGTPLWPSVLF